MKLWYTNIYGIYLVCGNLKQNKANYTSKNIFTLDCGAPRTFENATLVELSDEEVYDEGGVVSLPQRIRYDCSEGYGLVESSHREGTCVGGKNSSQFLFGPGMLEDYPQCVLG